jgi:thymidylate synthase
MDFNQQYLSIVKKVLKQGEEVTSRNSIVKQYFCPGSIEVPCVEDEFPILSIRPIPFYKSALETFFFLSGESSFNAMPEILKNSWWKPWANKAESQNSWGNFYGYQWRHQTTESGQKFDQWENLLEDLVDVVKSKTINRKMVVSLWRRQDAMDLYTSKPAVLDSCHSTSLVFNLVSSTDSWYLDLHHTQRSLDLMCGTGSDLIYSGLLMKLLCSEINFRTGAHVTCRKLVFSPSNAHIYKSHFEEAYRLLGNYNFTKADKARVLFDGHCPHFKSFQTIEDVKQFCVLEGYNPSPIKYNFGLVG